MEPRQGLLDRPARAKVELVPGLCAGSRPQAAAGVAMGRVWASYAFC